LHTVWMFSLIEEIIMHKVHGDDLERAIHEYLKFETSGWRHVINIQ